MTRSENRSDPGGEEEQKELKRQEAVEKLKEEPTEENLWNAIIAYENYPFYTASGLPFSYTLKKGKNGYLTKELWIDRREKSKSLSFGSIRLAFQNAGKLLEVTRPKALGDIRGVSYIYPIFFRMGIIHVPEKSGKQMLHPNEERLPSVLGRQP